ncbi:hypothetical protein Oweho_3054 [Owenweeksia hongkongensis DSM 17368]|uniref:Outer membrane protein beta-barrel domain-containing protein n=1 Tax=Owenweeksia hongkongensis (strain DSM 17368 / CIP 108786 / JCM 12287 / NRRL B-23963 / UST20020801) TaxID=926562 RepID=G8R2J7_OWEHD|nr:hypothetical protein [Owenweeksia hongkongensis]AEV34009.1 hypothetical protein Oweho_3054 [Owenweeksia hongkongensis DSM 17368]
MINSRYFFLLIFIGVSTFAFAQEDEDEIEGRIMFGIGAASMDFGELNKALDQSGYPSLDNIGWDWAIKLWISSDRLHFIYDFGSHSRQAENGAITKYETGDFALSLGYGVIQREHLSLIPYLGVGFDYGSLELVQMEDPSVNTVPGYITNAPYSQNMDVWGFLGSAGLYALWDFSSKSDDAAFTLGIHAGYTPRLGEQKWRSAGGSKLEGVSLSGGVSANLVFGVAL